MASAALAAFLIAAVVTAPPPAEDRARTIGTRIRCPVCQGESIAESPSQTARDMMSLVRDRIADGLTDQQIIDELIASYSGALLLDPPLAGVTIWLWLAPIMAIAIGVLVVSRRFRPSAAGVAPASAGPHATKSGSRRRMFAGGAVLIIAAAVTLALVGQFRQGRDEGGLLTGIADGGVDPATISNETMEAVIAANADHPDISGMRLALANRYFEEGRYQQAFPHYQAILEDSPTSVQAATAYTRLGWMVFDGNGEVDLALSLLDQALVAAPGDPFALYLKGRVLWCGQEDADGAASLFSQVIGSAALDDEVRGRVAADLEAAQAGEPCQ
jgi:cytochrome c-type biogenesis protein CcmH